MAQINQYLQLFHYFVVVFANVFSIHIYRLKATPMLLCMVVDLFKQMMGVAGKVVRKQVLRVIFDKGGKKREVLCIATGVIEYAH